MRSAGVVVGSPLFSDAPRGRESAKHVLVEALVAEAAIEAFDEAVLHRVARRNGVPFDALILLPLQDGARDQLSTVVRDDHQRTPAHPNEGIEFPHYLPGQTATCRPRA